MSHSPSSCIAAPARQSSPSHPKHQYQLHSPAKRVASSCIAISAPRRRPKVLQATDTKPRSHRSNPSLSQPALKPTYRYPSSIKHLPAPPVLSPLRYSNLTSISIVVHHLHSALVVRIVRDDEGFVFTASNDLAVHISLKVHRKELYHVLDR